MLVGSLKFLIKFIYGYIFGSLIWIAAVEPYRHYYDFTRGSYWPVCLFCLMVALIFLSSLWSRSIMVLFVPSMLGGATQNYIIVLLFTALVAQPVTNIGMNSVESVRVIGCSLTMTFDQLRERAKLVLNPIVEALSDRNQTDLSEIHKYIGRLRENVNLAMLTSKSSIGRSDGSGLRANLDIDELRTQLANKTRVLTATSKGTGQVNVIDTLYKGCLDMFVSAKGRCADTVADMYASCRSTLGPLLSTWWCSPVAYSLEKICPWVMEQVVDERSVCQQIRQFNVTETTNRMDGAANGPASTTSVNVNAAFAEMTKQLSALEASLQESATAGAGVQAGGDDKGQQRATERVQRFELSVSFNEKTRQMFLDAKQLMQLIGEKYKLRRLLVDILLFVYDIYTSYTFLLIIVDAWRYRRAYLSDVKFDNCYITQAFIELDQGEKPPRVLPLTRDESQKYIRTFTCRRRTKEERQLMSASCTSIVVFLAFALSLLYLDNIFYTILASIQQHSLVRFHETGHHEIEVTVRGEGTIARLVRRLASGLNSAYKLDRLTSTRGCLPDAQQTRCAFYWHFFGLCLAYTLIDQVAIYALRLRRVTCAYFYPHKERERLEYLYKFIKFQRRNLELCGLKSYLDDDEDHENNQRDGSETNKWLAGKGEDPDQQVVAYSLREALRYLRDCLARSSQKYCSCWRKCFFGRLQQ